jgi:hypothetical protein
MYNLDGVFIAGIVFATPVLIVWFVMLFQWKREEARTQLIGKAMELGKEIDPALLVSQSPVKQRRFLSVWPLMLGTILISLGLAVFVSVLLLAELEWASLSSLLLFPGIGVVIVYLLNRKNKIE